MYASVFRIKSRSNPDQLDLFFRMATGEFSYGACESFEKHLNYMAKMYNKHPEFKKKIDA